MSHCIEIYKAISQSGTLYEIKKKKIFFEAINQNVFNKLKILYMPMPNKLTRIWHEFTNTCMTSFY